MRPLNALTVLIIPLITLALTGCWSDAEQVDQAVWSDDDSEVAVVVLRFEEKSGNPLNGTTDKKNFRHQIYVQSLDGSGKTAIGGERSGQNGSQIYYMKSAGYLVVSTLTDVGMRFDRVALSGASTLIAETDYDSCKSHFFDVVPSPTGAQIAVISRSDACEDTSPEAPTPLGPVSTPVQVEVRFLNAQTLAELDAQTVDLATGSVAWTWRPDGAFVVTDGQDAVALTAGLSAVTTALPGCTDPKTSSSPVDASGVFVYPNPDGGLSTSTSSGADTFGCQ